MIVKYRAALCGLAILGCGSAAYAAIAIAPINTLIQGSAGILVTKDLTFQAQLPSGAIAGAAAAASSVGAASAGGAARAAAGSAATATFATTAAPANSGTTLVPQGVTPANLTLTGAAGDTISVSVPQTFSVTSNGGTGFLTVTNIGSGTNSVLGGSLRGNGALSVDVGSRIALAGQVITPGDYSGVLLVIGQYN